MAQITLILLVLAFGGICYSLGLAIGRKDTEQLKSEHAEIEEGMFNEQNRLSALIKEQK